MLGAAVVALAISGSRTLAADECGPEAVGADTITCDAGNYAGGGTYPDYPTGISYTGSDGLTLVIDDPALTAGGSISVFDAVNGSGNTEIRLVNFDTISGQAYAQAEGGGDARVVMATGVINASGTARGIYARTVRGGSSPTAHLQGGTINISPPFSAGFGGQTGAVQAWAWSSSDVGDVLVSMDGGEINITSDAAGLLATNTRGSTRTVGTTGVRMGGGTVNATGAGSRGVYVRSRYGLSYMDMSSGDIIATGVDATGIYAAVTSASVPTPDAIYRIQLSGGSVTGGSGLGSAIHTTAANGGVVDIASGVIVNGSASGIAIRDGDPNRDGIDEVGGDAVITSAGTVTGDAILGLGNDTFNLTGGTYTGDIYGDSLAASPNDGNDAFNWTGGVFGSSFFGGNGSDTTNISAPTYDGTYHVLDGGDDTLVTDGWIDVLTLDGITSDANGANIINWEVVNLDASAIAIVDGALAVGDVTDPATGLFLTNGSTLDAGTSLVLTGNLSVDASSTFEALGNGAGSYTVTGGVANNGTITTQDGAAGDVINVGGDYSGGGSLLVDTDFAAGTTDTLVITGNVTGGTTQVGVRDVGSGGASGGDVLIVDVGGTTAAGNFALAGGPFLSGIYAYDLVLNGSQWVLAGSPGAVADVYEAAPFVLGGLVNLPTLEQRVGQRKFLTPQVNQNGIQRGAWIRFHADRFDVTPSRSTNGLAYDGHTGGFQVGYDAPVVLGELGQWVFGATAQYGTISSKTSSAAGTGSIDGSGFGIGATVTWHGYGGFYLDAQAQVNWLEADYAAGGRSLASGQDAMGYTVGLELGQRYVLDEGRYLIPQAQLTWSSIDADAFTDDLGSRVDLGANDYLTGRLGLAYEYHGTTENEDQYALYAIGNLLWDFSDGHSVEAAGTTLRARQDDVWAELGLGGSLKWDDNAKMLYAQASYRQSLETSNSNGFGITAGFKATW